MTAAEEIKSNPYLNPNNCTDLADVESAMDSLRELDKKYPKQVGLFTPIWAKFLAKKKQLELDLFQHQLKSISIGDAVMFHEDGECYIGTVTSISSKKAAHNRKINFLNVEVNGTTHQVTKIV